MPHAVTQKFKTKMSRSNRKVASNRRENISVAEWFVRLGGEGAGKGKGTGRTRTGKCCVNDLLSGAFAPPILSDLLA